MLVGEYDFGKEKTKQQNYNSKKFCRNLFREK